MSRGVLMPNNSLHGRHHLLPWDDQSLSIESLIPLWFCLRQTFRLAGSFGKLRPFGEHSLNTRTE